MFRSSLCWAETTTSNNNDVQGESSPTDEQSKSKDTKENRLTDITVDKISDEQVIVKLSTLLSPRYGTILIPPAKDKKIWYFVINIVEAKIQINNSHARRKNSTQIFKKPLSHSLVKRIRATQFKHNPPTARVVFDLTTPQTPKITAAEDGLLVVFQKPQEENVTEEEKPKSEDNTEKVNNLTAVNVDISDKHISITFAFGHKPTYKSGMLPDKKNHRFYFYLNLRNTRSLVAGGKVFKQEIKDSELTRVMVSQYKREPPMARIVFYLNKLIKPQIVSEKGKLFVKFPRSGAPLEPKVEGGKQEDEKVGKRENGKIGKQESEKPQNSPLPKVGQNDSSDSKRAATKLTEIKIDNKAKDSITIQLILDGIPDYRTVLMPTGQTGTASFCINFLNTTLGLSAEREIRASPSLLEAIQEEKIGDRAKESRRSLSPPFSFEKDISEEPLKKVRAVQYKNNPPVARVIFDISDAIKPDIEENGYQLIVKYPRKESRKPGSEKVKRQEDGEEKSSLPPEREVGRIPTEEAPEAGTQPEDESKDDSSGDQSTNQTPDDNKPLHTPATIDETPSAVTDEVTDDTPPSPNGEEQLDDESVNVPDSSQPKQSSIIKEITAEILPKETILNIDIEGEIELRQATYVARSVEAKHIPLPRPYVTFSLKLAATIDNALRQIDISKGIIHDVVLNPLEDEEKNMEILVRLSEKVPYSVNSTDVSDVVYTGGEVIPSQRLVVKFENPPLEQLVSLSFDEESLSTVMLMLSQQYGANIVAGSNVSGTVSVHATSVPLKEALRQILQAEGYTYVQEPGGFLRVLKDEDATEETKVSTDLQQSEAIVHRRVIELKYALADELVESLQKIIGEQGSIVAEKRTNSLIVTDTEENLAELEGIIAQLDKKSSFASIDGHPGKDGNSESQDKKANLKQRIFHLSYITPDEASAYIRPLLSANGSLLVIESSGKSDKGTSTNITSSSIGGGMGGTDSMSSGITLGGTIMITDTEENLEGIQEITEQIDVQIPQIEIQAYIVEGTITNQDNLGIDWRMIANDGGGELSANLPFGGDFPALSLQVGNLSVDDFIGVLSILSARTDTKVLSSPKIMTIGNSPATFTSGDQIPYTELSINRDADTIATTSFKDTGIILHVTADVKRDNQISLIINTEVSDVAGFTPSGQPRISQRKATTQVLVKDNDTAVIGGLIMERSDETVSKVPILGDIPLLGRLFRTTNKKNVKSEVTVFITPRIVK